MIIEEKVYLIVSKCGKLVAKGTPRSRYICHIDEKDNKRFLTYASLGRANSGYQDCGFYLSKETEKYIIDNFSHLPVDWDGINHLFEAKPFKVKYESINLI